MMDISQQIKDKIYRLALSLLGSKEDAEDLTQEVIIKIWAKRHDGKNNQITEALALKITRDLSLNILKHRKVKRKKHRIMMLRRANNGNEGNNYENKDLIAITKGLIQQLPDMQRTVIHLRDIEGFEFEEIQQILEIDINAIRMNLSRARKKVRDELRNIINHGL